MNVPDLLEFDGFKDDGNNNNNSAEKIYWILDFIAFMPDKQTIH